MIGFHTLQSCKGIFNKRNWMDVVRKYKQRTGRPSGPSLDDFIYRSPKPLDARNGATLLRHRPTLSAANPSAGDRCV